MEDKYIYTVYMHISPSNKRYIGITKQKLERRWDSGHVYRTSPHFWRAIKKYGWNNFKHIILFEHLTKEEAIKKEIELIKKYNLTDGKYGYNITKGGDGINGVKLSYETRLKMSKNHHHLDQFKDKNPYAKPAINLNNLTVYCTVREANRAIGKGDNNSSISSVCLGRRKHTGKDKDGKRIKWQYLEDYLKNNNLSMEEAKNVLTFC